MAKFNLFENIFADESDDDAVYSEPEFADERIPARDQMSKTEANFLVSWVMSWRKMNNKVFYV